MSYINKGVPGIDQYLTLNEPDVGAALPKVRAYVYCVHVGGKTEDHTQELYPQNAEVPLLFKPFTIRGVTFNNRIFVVGTKPLRRRLYGAG